MGTGDSAALTALNKQTEGALADDDSVDVIVSLSDDASDYKGRMRLNRFSSKQLGKRSVQRQLANQAAVTQAEVFNELKLRDIPYKLHYSYNLLLNGFSARMTYAAAEEIAKLNQVESVVISLTYNRPEVSETPAMKNSSGIVGSNLAYDLGYTGKGMLTAVIDTGFDPTHQDFQMSDEDASDLALTLTDVDILLADTDLKLSKGSVKS